MSATLRRAGALVLLVALVPVLGCSHEPEQPKKGIVRGKVSLKGRPLAGVTVVLLHPDIKHSLSLKTEQDGSYEVRTYQGEGLAPGPYLVAVRPRYEFDTREEQVAAMLAQSNATNGSAPAPVEKKPGEDIPMKYRDPNTSGLKIEVASGENPPFDFDLTPGK